MGAAGRLSAQPKIIRTKSRAPARSEARRSWRDDERTSSFEARRRRAPPATVSRPAPRDGDSFRNSEGAFEPKGLGEVLKWRIAATRQGLPKPPQSPTPRVVADTGFLQANARAGRAMVPTATWIGHASTMVQLGGLTLLTDPIFSERASPLSFAGPRRHAAPGLVPGALPHIDTVVISHNHYDHLDAPSVDALAAQPGGSPRFVVPLGVGAWFAKRGLRDVVELDWWQSTAIGDAEIFLVPAQHWSGRGLGDRMKTLWGGYAVFAPGFQLFFAGDTAYSRDFTDIHRRFAARHGADRGFDLALIPIGAYEPRWFMKPQHVDPREAVQIHLDVAAEASIGIHWGTFQLTDESLDEPPRALAAACRAAGIADAAFSVMAIGETRRFAIRRP